jgi:glycosyltransferase involved in cell wall biosynthesis
MNFTDVDINDVSVMYTPSKHLSFVSQSKSIINGRYVLIIGCNRWEKNCYRSILAIEKLLHEGKLQDYQVVCIGKIPSIIKKRIKNIQRYVLLDYVAPEVLESLYQYCDIFLYTSLNEGFGMPPLEAMAYGKTCVVSAVCSLPSIYGDSVYYCNPYDVMEIANRILWALHEKIDNVKIYEQVAKIKERQTTDIKRLCNFIVSKGLSEGNGNAYI